MSSQTTNTTTAAHTINETFLRALLAQQKQAYQAHPKPSAAERIANLNRLKKVLVQYQDEIAQAICTDYGNRSLYETKIGELLTCIQHIQYYAKNLKKWMKPAKRHVSWIHQPAKAWVDYQPLGVIGIITPWNYPLLLALGPLICALAAGNHAMIKMSSDSACFGALLEKILAEVFEQNHVAVINGGGMISEAFSHLPFDKIIFTGSTRIGQTVMRAASENLVPVILELGGKSPTIVHKSMPMHEAALRIAFGKLWNAGQTCVAPDYLFLPKNKTEEFVQHYREQVQKMYPHLKDNADYTNIINQRQYDRLQHYLQDAQQQGATVVEINPQNEALENTGKIAPTLLLNVHADMQIMQNEIFGPILPILEYEQIDEVIAFINSRARPLALYYFDFDQARADYLCQRTHSGHFGLNTVLTHVAQDDLPFGGVGASGMGKYHGPEGFFSLSNERSVMSNPKFFSLKFILPPFNKPIHRLISKFLLR